MTDRAGNREQPPRRVVPGQRGGWRPGAGRKPKGDKAGVSHGPRAALEARFPTHVTVALLPGLPSLRSKREYTALCAAFAEGCDRNGLRLTHYKVLDHHLHFLVEARNRECLTRGMQGLMIRIAKGLNRVWKRHGRVFADRYLDRILKTPREVRDALCSVLANGNAAGGRAAQVRSALDTFNSAPWFDGFRRPLETRDLEAIERPVAVARTWLLRTGWRRLGLINMHELRASP